MKSLIPLLAAISHNLTTLNIRDMSDDLIDFSIDLGMGVFLKHCSKNALQASKPATTQLLISVELTAKLITNNLLNAVKEILILSEQCTDDVILLKGISNCQRYYPEPWFRIMSDIDLLVSEKDAQAFETILLKLGYQQTSKNSHDFYEFHHHSMPFYNKKNNVWIEVHTHLFSKTTHAKHDKLFSIEQINKNTAQPFNSVYYKNVKQLSTELHLIYSCVHWADDFSTHKSCMQLTDIILMLKNNDIPLDWHKINNWLYDTNSASCVFLALSYLHKSKIIEIPPLYFNNVKLKHYNMGFINVFILHNIIDNYFMQGKNYGRFLTENNIIIIWETLLQAKTSWINILQIPLNILFPPDNINRFKLSLMTKRFFNVFKR